MTSALRLHDATHVFLSMKHDVEKQAANQMALDADKGFFLPTHFLGSCDNDEKLTFLRDQEYGLEVFCTTHVCESNVCSFSTTVGGARKDRKSARAPC